ncbi:MAG: zinc ribbon domain-containing protein [Anaerolineae bacterium]|nr:MAG: zinc ribbon domain-containing protein [Anaerolineae bacterium]
MESVLPRVSTLPKAIAVAGKITLPSFSYRSAAMPIYDYRCLDCGKRFEQYFSYEEYGKKPATCTHCGSTNVTRRLPRVRVVRSEESRLESLEDFADPAALDGLEEDPRALGRMMRKMGEELGEELPPEFDEVVDRLEAGQSPEEIEKAIPELGEGLGEEGDDADLDL